MVGTRRAIAVCSMMFIDFKDFTQDTEKVVREVCTFVGAEPTMYSHKPLPAGMKVSAHVHCTACS